MNDGKIKNEPYCDLRIGAMFYFYEDPEMYRQQIIEMFHEYCNLTEAEFTSYRHNEDIGFKSLKKNGEKFFNDIIEKSDFESSEHLILTNATKENVQTVKFETKLRNLKPEFPIKLPNYMYFEFLPTVDYEEIFHFIKEAFWGIPYHYCCCNFLMGANDFQNNRGRQYAAKFVREKKCLSDYYSVLKNMSLHCEIEHKIDGPNMIQVLSKKLYDEIGILKLIDECENNDIYHEMGEGYIMIAMSEELASDEMLADKYQALYYMLENIILDMEKPQMYWKMDEWKEWRSRFKKSNKDLAND